MGAPYDPNAARAIMGLGPASPDLGDAPGDVAQRIARLGLSPRQQLLNRLWGLYRCQQYDMRKYDWNGRQVLDHLSHEAIATEGILPPGFVDLGGSTLPLKFRKPSAPYNLIRVIVNRFSGLLFSERRHPQMRVEGDPEAESFLKGMATACRLWPTMIQARAMGGAMGSVCLGFQFVNGLPSLEVHDPRWVIPTFKDRDAFTLAKIEKRYMYPVEVRDGKTGEWREEWLWYRRIIDEQVDVLCKAAPVGDGEEPRWEIESKVVHGLGFCPAVWIQNLPVLDDTDGDPDCHGIFDTAESIDALIAQANKGTLANSDPTLVITTDMDLSAIQKGSDNAIKLTGQGNNSAQYLELQGTGPKAAMDLAKALRGQALEVAQCVLDNPDNPGVKTATEVERDYSSMMEKGDVLREQYGERGVKPLMEMMVRAAAVLSQPRLDADGGLSKQALRLPPLSGVTSALEVIIARLGGEDCRGRVELRWPAFFTPNMTEVGAAVTAAVNAKQAGLVDDEAATNFVAEHFRIEDVRSMLERLRSNAAAEQASLDEMATKGITGAALSTAIKTGLASDANGGGEPAPPGSPAPQPPSGAPPPAGPDEA